MADGAGFRIETPAADTREHDLTTPRGGQAQTITARYAVASTFGRRGEVYAPVMES